MHIDYPSDGQGEISEGRIGSGSSSPETKSTTRRNLFRMGAGLAAVTGLSRGLVLRPSPVIQSTCRRRRTSLC